MLDAIEDWQLSSRESLTDLLFTEGQSRETYNVATSNVYANWENGVGNLLGDKPEGTGWAKDGSEGQQNGPGSTGSPRGYMGGIAGDFIGGFDSAPVPPLGRGTGGRGSMLPPRPETNEAVDQSYRPMSGEDLLLHPNTVAFLRKHPEFAKAFIEREGFGNLRRLNTVLSYGWTANLDDWFLGRDRYYASTSNLEMWIDTDMSIEDQTNALVELVDDIYSEKKIPLDTHGNLAAFGNLDETDTSVPRTQAYIQAVYGSTEFGRGVATDIALEATIGPFVLLSKGDDAYRILSKLDDAAPVGGLADDVLRSGRYAKDVFEGRTIYRAAGDFDLGVPTNVDPKFVHQSIQDKIKNGWTNADLMRNGNSPIGKDGRPMNLHHLLGDEPGPMVEILGSTHSKYHRPLHGLVESGNSFRNVPGLESKYKAFAKRYWKWRLTELTGN